MTNTVCSYGSDSAMERKIFPVNLSVGWGCILNLLKIPGTNILS